MSRWYLDTSAALKLLVDEAESDVLARSLDRERPELAAGWLLETELRRTVHRAAGLHQSAVTHLLRGVSLYEMPQSLYREAGLLSGNTLRSLDALHLAAALRLGVDAVLTYDHRMADAAEELGMVVLRPA